MTKKDLAFSIGTGALTGIIASKVLIYLGNPTPFGVPALAFVFAIPIIWIIGVQLGFFLSKWMLFFKQFGKFSAIGFTNFAVDIGVLNYIISQTGATSGLGYSFAKTVAVAVATVTSYIFNKYWAFEAGNTKGGTFEFVKFVTVATFGLVINVGVASTVVNYLPAVFGLQPTQWANVGAVAGSMSALVFSFIGFKLIVFKR